MSIALSNPFGDDDVDLPVGKYFRDLRAIISILGTCSTRPPAMEAAATADAAAKAAKAAKVTDARDSEERVAREREDAAHAAHAAHAGLTTVEHELSRQQQAHARGRGGPRTPPAQRFRQGMPPQAAWQGEPQGVPPPARYPPPGYR